MIPFSSDNSILYSNEIKRKTFSIYWIILIMLLATIISLPFIKIDISVKTDGIIRPIDEKTEVKSSISTIIDSIYCKEGDTVKEGSILIQLRRENIAIKKTQNDFEIKQRDQFITDLITLTHSTSFTNNTVNNLESPVYKQQCSQFVFELSELTSELKKVDKEMYMDSLLSIDKVISPKEMFDKQIEHEKLIENIRATEEQKIAIWQGDLAKYQLEKSQFQNANHQLVEDNSFYSIRAPISGVIQSFNKYYPGSLVEAGETLAEISPQAQLVAECYVNTRDVGLLKIGQPTIFQVDAFDYNYFGILTGKIYSIDNDYIVIDDKPVFKVRCLLDNTQLNLKNGFAGNLKKGMTLQARFITTKRSLWQLLFDTINDWLNPGAPEKN